MLIKMTQWPTRLEGPIVPSRLTVEITVGVVVAGTLKSAASALFSSLLARASRHRADAVGRAVAWTGARGIG